MKALLLLPLTLLTMCQSGTAQDQLTEGAAQLFDEVPSTLTAEDQNALFELANFQLAANGTQYHFKGDDHGAQFPFDVQVLPFDFNKDSVEEVVLVYGNTYTSGGTGASSLLFVKDSNGAYQSHFGVPGFLYLMPSTVQGYPEIMVQGMGFEFAIWAWDGKAYAFNRRIAQSESDKLVLVSVADASKAYVDGLKP